MRIGYESWRKGHARCVKPVRRCRRHGRGAVWISGPAGSMSRVVVKRRHWGRSADRGRATYNRRGEVDGFLGSFAAVCPSGAGRVEAETPVGVVLVRCLRIELLAHPGLGFLQDASPTPIAAFTIVTPHTAPAPASWFVATLLFMPGVP